MSHDVLDRFGSTLMRECRDRAIANALNVIQGKATAPSLADIRQLVGSMDDKSRSVVCDLCIAAIDDVVHEMLFMLAESKEFELRSTAEPTSSLARLSDGLQGEPFGPRGWIRRFSQYPPAPGS